MVGSAVYSFFTALIGTQNPDFHLGRVVRYNLNPAMDAITSAQVLEEYGPQLELPTTGTLAGHSLLYMANTQIDREGPTTPCRRSTSSATSASSGFSAL